MQPTKFNFKQSTKTIALIIKMILHIFIVYALKSINYAEIGDRS